MKATKIYYKRLNNLGNFQNEEIGIEVQLEDGETAKNALEQAKRFIEANGFRDEFTDEYNSLVRKIENPEYVTVGDLNKAKERVKEIVMIREGREHNIPF